jgi:hypothetical protein
MAGKRCEASPALRQELQKCILTLAIRAIGKTCMFARQRCLLLSAFVLLLASAIDADAATWKKYSNTVDGFEVEFSGAVKVTPTEIDAETAKKLVRSTNYLQDEGSYAYIVGATLLKGEVNFDAGVKASMGKFECKTMTSDTPLNFTGGRAREVRGTDCVNGTRAECRYFTKGKWFYQVISLFKQDGGDVAAARYFLQSFKVIANK